MWRGLIYCTDFDDNTRRRIAMDKAIADCKQKGYLINYLDRKEFKTMVQKEFTFEDYCRVKAEDSRREGLFRRGITKRKNIIKIAKKI